MTGSFLSEPEPSPALDRDLAGDVAHLGYVMNLTRLWGHLPGSLGELSDLTALASTAAGLTHRQRAVLVTATASAMGDSYCSLAWGGRLARDAGDDVPAAVVRGCDGPLDDAERTLARWARQVATDPNGTTATDVERLREAGYDDATIFAITFLVALRVAFSTVNDALGAVPDRALHEDAPPSLREAVRFGRCPEPAENT